jgi:hypothetical protein
MTYLPEVKVSHEELDWLVWLDGALVGRYDLIGDALHYASMLECDPRSRSEASPAA